MALEFNPFPQDSINAKAADELIVLKKLLEFKPFKAPGESVPRSEGSQLFFTNAEQVKESGILTFGDPTQFQRETSKDPIFAIPGPNVSAFNRDNTFTGLERDAEGNLLTMGGFRGVNEDELGQTFFNQEKGFFEFPELGGLIRSSSQGRGDLFPDVQLPEGFGFAVVSGDIVRNEAVEGLLGGPVSSFIVPGTENPVTGGFGETPQQVFNARREQLDPQDNAQVAFRQRFGRGRGTTILGGGLGDANILGGNAGTG